MDLSTEAFEAIVADAMDRIPMAFAQLLDNIVVQIRDRPTPAMIESVGLDPRSHTLFGLYTGVALDRRGEAYGNVLPDVVFLFRRPLVESCRTRGELLRQIQLTLLHEIGHHLGFDDEQMRAWETAFPGLEESSRPHLDN